MKKLILISLILLGCKKQATQQPSPTPTPTPTPIPTPTTNTITIGIKGYCSMGSLKVDWDASKTKQIWTDSSYTFQQSLKNVTKAVNSDSLKLVFYNVDYAGGPNCNTDLTISVNGIVKYSANAIQGTQTMWFKVF